LYVILYGCETWSVIKRKEHRLKTFENEVLRRIFGLMGCEERGEWRTLYNEELHKYISSPYTITLIKRG